MIGIMDRQNEAEAFVCLRGSLTVRITDDVEMWKMNKIQVVIHQFDIHTSIPPVSLFASIQKSETLSDHGVRNPMDILQCIVQAMEYPTMKCISQPFIESFIESFIKCSI